MFFCLFGEVGSYLFYSKRPTNPSILTIFPPKEQKEEREKRLQHKCFPVNFPEFLRTPFFKITTIGCLWRWTRWNQSTAHSIPIEQLLSLNDSLWIILVTRRNERIITFFYSRPKVKIRKLFFWGWCNGTQCTRSVLPLIFCRIIFPYHILKIYTKGE